MHGSTSDHVEPGQARAVEVLVLGPAPCPRAVLASDPLQVMVVAADPGRRRRLTDALAGLTAVEVVGWAVSLQDLAVMDRSGTEGVCALGVGSGDARTAVTLSPRQVDVLVGYASGNELLGVVARRLGMSVETVKTHLRRIRGKYTAAGRPSPTRRDLYVRAVEDGHLPSPW